jgi:hypothetical protein
LLFPLVVKKKPLLLLLPRPLLLLRLLPRLLKLPSLLKLLRLRPLLLLLPRLLKLPSLLKPLRLHRLLPRPSNTALPGSEKHKKAGVTAGFFSSRTFQIIYSKLTDYWISSQSKPDS